MWSKGNQRHARHMLGEQPSQVNGQDQLVKSGNYCCLSIWVTSIAEENSHRKISKTRIQTRSSNRIAIHTGYQEMHSAVVGTRTPLMEKLAIELKTTFNVATFNICTLNTINQLPKLISSSAEKNRASICVQDHKYGYSEIELRYHESRNQ